MVNHPLSGLCCPHGGLYHQVPLRTVRVDASVYDLCAEVMVHQTYVNERHHAPMECIYIFPLDEESAIFSFTAELDGVVVQSRLKEKTEARAIYNSAITHHRSAMLLEQSCDNIFQCKVGHLNPGSICTISITYLTKLEQEGRYNRITLPMIIAPKYTPSVPGLTPAPAPLNAVHTAYSCHQCLCVPIIGTRHHCNNCACDLCDGCSVHHDSTHALVTFNGQKTASSSLALTPGSGSCKLTDLTINIFVTMPSPILSIQCPSHESETQIDHQQSAQHNDLHYHACAFFHSASTSSLSKDFIVLVEQERCFEPRVLCELDMTMHTAALSLAFIPPPLDMGSVSQIHCELVFVIDCSGSMSGASIACVRDCMQLLLRSLPVHALFNIFTFGSSWSSLFPKSQAYDDASLAAASKYVSNLRGNRGGTEIYPPLHHALTMDVLPTHPRQVFLLTDGQVNNVEQLVHLTAQHALSIRLFTFGIGQSVDRLLCKKLAQAGHGKCEFVTADDGGGSKMREKVVRQVARAMQPMLTNVKVEWGSLAQGSLFLQCPSVAPPIFMNSRYVLHAMNVNLPQHLWQAIESGANTDFKCEITITASSNHPQELGCLHHSVVLSGQQITRATVIHTMTAKERIRELEDKAMMGSMTAEEGEKMDDEILQLAMKHTLSSRKTSFVVVHNEGNEESVEDVLSTSDEICGTRFNSPASGHKSALPPPLFGSGSRLQRRLLQQSNSSPTTAHMSCGTNASFGSGSPQNFFLQVCNERNEEKIVEDVLGALNQRNEQKIVEDVLRAPNHPPAPFGSRTPQNFSVQDFCNPYSIATGIASPGGGLEQMILSRPLCAFSARKSTMSESDGSSRKDAESRAFEELIGLQSASGMWRITSELEAVCHAIIPHSVGSLSVQSLQALSKEHGVDEAIVGVMVALLLLEKHYMGRQAEWQMLASKALYFVSERAKISTEVQEEIKSRIMSLLQC